MTDATTAVEPDRHYTILDIVHNDNGTGAMEVLFHEDGHTLRYNLWLPDDPAMVDAEIRARWPHVDFANKKAASANIRAKIDQFRSLVSVKTPVKGLIVPPASTSIAPQQRLGVQRP